MASDSSMCPGVDSTSKNEYQDNPGGKGGRCVRPTTYHLHVPIAKKSGGLNLLEPCGPVQACNGTALPLPLPTRVGNVMLTLQSLYSTVFLKHLGQSSTANWLLAAHQVGTKVTVS